MRKNKLYLLTMLVLGLSLCPAVRPATVSAQSGKSKAVSVEPFMQEVILGPGDQSKTFNVRITNNTTAAFRFNLSAVDFGSLDETGGVFFSGTNTKNLDPKYGLAKWIELDSSDQSLPPSQSTQLDIKIINRADLPPGGHYGAIFINSAGSGSDGAVSFKQSISSLVLAIKRGGEHYDLSLAGITTDKGLASPPEKIRLRFKNAGNTHVVPRGTVLVKDGSGKVYARGIINQESSYVLPGTFRQIPVQLKQETSYPPRPLNSYRLEVSYRYDGLDRFATKTYPLRWYNLGLILGLLGVVAAFALAYSKKYHKNLKIKKLFR